MSLIERAVGRLQAEQSPRVTGSGAASRAAAAEVLDPSAPPDTPHRSQAEAAGPVPPARPMHPPLAIPLQRLARQGFIVPGAEPARTLNEFRIIKRPLVYNVSDRRQPALQHSRRIMITSALPGEGKTFCAINLALSIADERDHSVMLVDADVARPRMPQTLGVEPAPGLMDALADPAVDVAGLVLPTSIDNLSVLMAGSHHAKATEMLASAAMNRLLDGLSARFPDHIIIFDSPPLLATTEASVLASHMGQIVLIVEAGRTQHGAVTAAIGSLEAAPGVISTLMNKTPPRRKNSFLPYEDYGYSYGTRA